MVASNSSPGAERWSQLASVNARMLYMLKHWGALSAGMPWSLCEDRSEGLFRGILYGRFRLRRCGLALRQVHGPHAPWLNRLSPLCPVVGLDYDHN